MVGKPLDLSSKLTPSPQDWDWVHYVNVGLIALFFTLFGSRFVLSPGLGTSFVLPEVPEASLGAMQTTHVVSVKSGGIIFADPGGKLTLEEFRHWLGEAARSVREPRLLVRASADVSLGELAVLRSAAEDAGFVGVVWGAERPAAATRKASEAGR